ncbi:hypothetical protein AB0953_29495 [Streptomyces sp. NPDC046866]|uniref:hypothetical protein n=1 Tax=Streptomyces sp. NPDC046866 TaxID=3154921 RepID=UPI003456C2D2
MPVAVTALEQLQEHGADGAVWRRLGRTGEQMLTAALDNPNGDAPYRPVGELLPAPPAHWPLPARAARSSARATWSRREESTACGGAGTARDRTVCGICHADDVAREEAVRRQATAPPPTQGDQEPGWPTRGLFRRGT